MSLSLDEIRKQTASILDADIADGYVSQITQESIDEMVTAKPKDNDLCFASSADANEKNLCSHYYGHDMRYDGNKYLFRASDGCPGNGCGMDWWTLDMRYWKHEFRGRRCGNHNNMAELKFTRR